MNPNIRSMDKCLLMYIPTIICAAFSPVVDDNERSAKLKVNPLTVG